MIAILLYEGSLGDSHLLGLAVMFLGVADELTVYHNSLL